MSTVDFEEAVTPSQEDAKLAQESSSALARILIKSNKVNFKVYTEGKEKREETVTIPASAFRLLSSILAEMAQGKAVTLIPFHAELTTQQAADILNVSRPFLIGLLENGKLPFHRVGTHRRVRYQDLISYKRDVDTKRAATLEELAKQAQELNMGYGE